jgi:hypothetical protein
VAPRKIFGAPEPYPVTVPRGHILVIFGMFYCVPALWTICRFFLCQVSLASRGWQGLRLSFNFTGENDKKRLVAPGFSTSKPLVNVPCDLAAVTFERFGVSWQIATANSPCWCMRTLTALGLPGPGLPGTTLCTKLLLFTAGPKNICSTATDFEMFQNSSPKLPISPIQDHRG